MEDLEKGHSQSHKSNKSRGQDNVIIGRVGMVGGAGQEAAIVDTRTRVAEVDMLR